jgi:hypothetical protein
MNSTQELLTLTLTTDVRPAMLGIKQLQASITGNMKKIQTTVQKSDKGFGRLMKTVTGFKTKNKGIKELKDQMSALDKALNQRKDQYREEVEKAKKAPRGSQERKDAMANVKKMKDATQVSDLQKQRHETGGKLKELEETPGFDWKAINAGAEEAGEHYAEPLHDLLSKDAPRMMKGAAKAFIGLHTAALKTGSLGKTLSEKGSHMMGKKGLGSKIMGGAAKGGGELMKVLGGITSIFTSLGPILSVAGSFMMSFVKIILDAEAAVKEYNKAILASSGTAGYFARNMGRSEDAAKDMEESLRGAQEGVMEAMSSMNISKDAAIGFQTAVTKEGVALDALGKKMGTAEENADAHAKSIKMAVAYSRQFGVSLGELGQLQGQLMGDIGMSANEVTAGFESIRAGANAAGMESNKFFGIVRSFSSDLSLFTLRLAEVTKIMGVLGKTMDPRKMNQFLQTLNQKFEGSITDNLKFQMLAGPEGTEIANKDMGDKLEAIKNNIRETLGPGEATENEIASLVEIMKKNDPRELAQWQLKNDKKLNGKLNSAIEDQMNLQARLGSKDALDQASVMGALGPLAKIATLQAISQKQNHTGLENLQGLALANIESMGVASDKEIQGYKKLIQGAMIGQEALIKAAEQGNLNEEQKAQVERMNIKGNHEEVVKQLTAMLRGQGGFDAYMRSLDQTTQEQMLNANKVETHEQATKRIQTSIMDEIQQVTDVWLMKIWNILHDIWGAIMNWFAKFSMGEKSHLAYAKVAASTANIPGLEDALMGGGTPAEMGAKMVEKVGKGLIDRVNAAVAESKGLKEQLSNERDPKKLDEIRKRLKELEPVLSFDKFDEKTMKYEAQNSGVDRLTEHLIKMQAALDKAVPVKKSAAPAPGTPEAKGTETAKPPVAATEAAASETSQQATTDSVKELQRAVTGDGIKLSAATVAGPLKDSMADSVYEGTAKALFEYYMYSGLNRSTVAGAIGSGVSPAAIAQSMTGGKTPETALNSLVSDAAAPHAMGGTVMGIRNGMAQINGFPSAAAGEGWASVGRGETIVPAGSRGGGGGGGVKVELELKGDLKRFIEARVVEGAAAHDRNKRLR